MRTTSPSSINILSNEVVPAIRFWVPECSDSWLAGLHPASLKYSIPLPLSTGFLPSQNSQYSTALSPHWVVEKEVPLIILYCNLLYFCRSHVPSTKLKTSPLSVGWGRCHFGCISIRTQKTEITILHCLLPWQCCISMMPLSFPTDGEAELESYLVDLDGQ